MSYQRLFTLAASGALLIEQMITLRDVEALSGDLAGRIRARATQQTSTAAASTLEAAVHDQLK